MKEREPGQTPMYMGSEEITICGGNEGVKGVLYIIWCGVNRLGDSGVKVV